jgi:hypothetical protein
MHCRNNRSVDERFTLDQPHIALPYCRTSFPPQSRRIRSIFSMDKVAEYHPVPASNPISNQLFPGVFRACDPS